MVERRQSGQILLVVVLAMIIALTVGLAIAARVVTELRLSKQNEESQRAFQAAEAGVQQSLEAKGSVDVDLGNNANFTTLFTSDPAPLVMVNNGLEVDQTIGADVWLSDYSADPNLLFADPMGCPPSGPPCSSVPITMYWGSTDQNQCNSTGSDVAPAIEVVLLKGPITSPTIQKNIYESVGCTRIPNASASNGAATQGGVSYRNSAPLRFGGANLSNGLVMRVIPIFNSTIVAFSSGINFPSQGSVVESTGESGNTVRRVEYFQSHPQLPLEVFPYSLISQ